MLDYGELETKTLEKSKERWGKALLTNARHSMNFEFVFLYLQPSIYLLILWLIVNVKQSPQL